MSEFLTIKEAAERLGVSEKTVRRRIKDGTLSAELQEGAYGQQYFISTSAIDTAQEITDVVKVERTNDPRTLAMAIVQALESRDRTIEHELVEIRKEIAASQEPLKAEVEELRNELRDARKLQETLLRQRDEKLMQDIRKALDDKKRPWWKVWG